MVIQFYTVLYGPKRSNVPRTALTSPIEQYKLTSKNYECLESFALVQIRECRQSPPQSDYWASIG